MGVLLDICKVWGFYGAFCFQIDWSYCGHDEEKTKAALSGNSLWNTWNVGVQGLKCEASTVHIRFSAGHWLQ